MYEKYLNIFKAARITAGLTQESAAELLEDPDEGIEISVESIKAYENDTRRPKPSLIRRMIEVYKAPFLEAQYAMQDEICSNVVPPTIKQLPVQLAGMAVFKENQDAQPLIAELFNISYLGVSDEHQRQRYNELCEDLFNKLAGAILSLKYAIE
jgi:transcriptional regulator with XRE-family HTH domain